MDTPVLAVGPSFVPADAARLGGWLRGLPRGTGGAVVVCDVGALAVPDLASLDALARLQLMAGRLGYRVRLRGASQGLLELLTLTGFDALLPLWVEPVGQAEEREEPLGVEEGVEPGDPAL